MLTLLGTEHCHLCELAVSLLDLIGVDYTEVDIIDDERLLARYGTSIPVLLNDLGEELHWPFSLHDIKQLVKPN